MKLIADNLWLCQDCVMAAVNNDYTGLDYHYNEHEAKLVKQDIEDGLAVLGPGLVPMDEEEEFSRRDCDCCGNDLAGYRMKFGILGD